MQNSSSKQNLKKNIIFLPNYQVSKIEGIKNRNKETNKLNPLT